MAINRQYESDITAILAHRHDNGADLWTTPDKRLIKGSPFSTLESVMYLLELGMEPSDPLLLDAAELIYSTWREDGRFRLYPQGSIYPCQTINAVCVLCHMGYASDARVQTTLRHLFDTRHTDVAGAAISSVMATGRRLNFPIRFRHLSPWMLSVILIISIMGRYSTSRWTFCLNIGP